jgi:nicotinate-nucleotide adenylyltransferase
LGPVIATRAAKPKNAKPKAAKPKVEPGRDVFVTAPGPVAQGLRIGLLGGSFNPAHEGHVHASEQAMKKLGLDYVWWLVSPQNPLKPAEGMAGLKKRLTDARKVARHPRIVVTDIETALGVRYTADTIALLQRHFPQVHFVWLMGSDNLVQIPRWKRWRSIFRSVPVAVVARNGSVLHAQMGTAARMFAGAFRPANRLFPTLAPPAWTWLDGHRNPASATALRKRR